MWARLFRDWMEKSKKKISVKFVSRAREGANRANWSQEKEKKEKKQTAEAETLDWKQLQQHRNQLYRVCVPVHQVSVRSCIWTTAWFGILWDSVHILAHTTLSIVFVLFGFFLRSASFVSMIFFFFFLSFYFIDTFTRQVDCKCIMLRAHTLTHTHQMLIYAIEYNMFYV